MMLRRAGLIGDVHCQVARLQQALALFRGSGVDAVLAVGDIADGPGDLTETCAVLQQAGVLAVAGNHERWLLNNEMRDLPDANQLDQLAPPVRRYLGSLPRTRFFESPRGTVLLCHGLGEDDMGCVRPDDDGKALLENTALRQLIASRVARFVVNGHSHRPMLRTVDGLTILNAGTLHPKHRPVCSIADFESGQMQLYDVELTRVRAAEQWSFERGSRPTQ